MDNFNFTGSTAPQRHMNLGGASAGSTKSQAQLAAAARAERAQREQLRRQQAAARHIQATWRSHQARVSQRRIWYGEASQALQSLHSALDVARAVRLVAYATGAGLHSRPSKRTGGRHAARPSSLSNSEVDLLVQTCTAVILSSPQPVVLAAEIPAPLLRTLIRQVMTALNSQSRQAFQPERLSTSEVLVSSLSRLLQSSSGPTIAITLIRSDLYVTLSDLLASIPTQQKAAPTVKHIIDVALAPFKLLTVAAFPTERGVALQDFTRYILTTPHLPNRIALQSLSQLVAFTPFEEVINLIVATGASDDNSSLLASPHLLANIMVVGGGARRVSMFKTDVQLSAYLDALRLMQNILPASTFFGPSDSSTSKAVGKGKTRASTSTSAADAENDAFGMNGVGEDTQGLFDDERSRAKQAEAQSQLSRSGSNFKIDKTTYNRILTLTSDAHLTAILTASTKFAASSRFALYAFLCSIVTAGWPVAIRERALGSVIYVGAQASGSGPGTAGVNAGVGGFIRELWRGYIRGGELARMLAAGPEEALKSLSVSAATTSPASTSSSFSSLNFQQQARKEALERQWPALVLICELYSRALLTMGDTEFMPDATSFTSISAAQSATSSSNTTSLGLKNPLTIDEVVSLSALLRNLVFALYWYEGSSLLSSALSLKGTASSSASFSQYYLSGSKLRLGDLRSLLTKVLQQLYTRDSRRPFTPKGHWEMLSKNDLQAFINTVIMEEKELVEGSGATSSSTDVDGSRASRRRDLEQAEMMDLVEEEDDAENEDPRRQAAQRGLSETVEPARNLPISQRLRNRSRMGGTGSLTASMMAFLSPRLGVLNNIPFVIPFDVRVEIFRQFIRNDRARFDVDRYDPMDLRRPVSIRRGHVAEDGFRGLHRFGSALKQRIQIQFVDEFGFVEAGIDGGGLFKEFLTSLVREAFDTNRGLWKATADQAIYPNPHSYAQQPEQLEWYTFLGRVLGKAIYEGILVDIKFASFFLSKWLGKQSYLDDLASLDSLDPDLAKGLNFVLRAYTGDFEDLALNFTVTDEEFGVSTTTELVPGGAHIPVTRENRLEYVYRVSHYRLSDQIEKQSAAFFSGLSEMVDPRWLRMMNREELRVLVSGTEAPIDLDDLRANTVYGGYHEQDLTIQYFWNTLKSFDPQMRKAFLKFVTSCPSPPLLGFEHLSPKFAIRRSGDDETRLPTASTCVNLLKLPAYSTEEQLAAKLRYVCTIDAGFDLS
ncbi:ubiquitin-protein ligase (E3) [Tilletia horrida]|uniref:HECT-type E3 ubiquitin transferase n=1 Tax=Tilletia horrida TaxID=155126 RepID=A0AAN6GTL0_9BASI|nr:ubiquitin-protein ligase (E3) [Tilletia horrida]KAK0564579.1 ubiquitin-protein ligase (E3) [Tilletia horrida]